jgi:hypothetical protein
MSVQDNDAFKKMLSFMFKPSASGAKEMKGVLKKHGKPIRGSKTKARRNRRMSSMVGQS